MTLWSDHEVKVHEGGLHPNHTVDNEVYSQWTDNLKTECMEAESKRSDMAEETGMYKCCEYSSRVLQIRPAEGSF